MLHRYDMKHGLNRPSQGFTSITLGNGRMAFLSLMATNINEYRKISIWPSGGRNGTQSKFDLITHNTVYDFEEKFEIIVYAGLLS